MIPTKEESIGSDNVSNQMREPVIKSMAEKVIVHTAANGGIC